MHKIILAGVIKPTDDLTAEEIVDGLLHLGGGSFFAASEVEVVPADEIDHPKEVWVYVPFDDSLPYSLVAGPQDTGGELISEPEINAMRDQGICLAFHAEYPRADRYGAPLYSVDNAFAEGEIGKHGFRVPEDGIEVVTNDRRDDGGQQLWLKIALPA